LKKTSEDLAAVDVSYIEAARGQYICPNCGVFMDPRRIVDLTEFVCPSCGMIKNPLTDSMKHGSTLMPAVTEEMITEQDELHIFEVADDDSVLPEPKEEPNEILEQDKQQDEAWRKKGFKVTTI
jgi:predicted RNA-binding Zn-ribbon protein involved in translation (DUF1610 family)